MNFRGGNTTIVIAENQCEKNNIKKRVYIASSYSASSDFVNFKKRLNFYYQITSQSCILCAAETLKQEHCGKQCRSSILVLMAAILVEDIIRNIYMNLFVYGVQGMSYKDISV